VPPYLAFPDVKSLANHPDRRVKALTLGGSGELATLVGFVHAVKMGLVFPAYG